MEAFWILLRLHDLLVLLFEAQKLKLPSNKRQELDELMERLCPPTEWNIKSLKNISGGSLTKEVRLFLISLRDELG